MPVDNSSITLAPDLAFTVQWSDRVADFTAIWEQRLADALPGPDHLLDAALTVQSGIEQRQHQTEDTLADVYRVSGQLPATGDEVLVGALVMRVDQRDFVTTYTAGIPRVTVAFRMGIERYRYETKPAGAVTSIMH
jgi:hypothetical protein